MIYLEREKPQFLAELYKFKVTNRQYKLVRQRYHSTVILELLTPAVHVRSLWVYR